MKILVTGAAGFIGHHLVNRLKAEGHHVRGVDLRQPEFAPTVADEFQIADLRALENCVRATEGMDDVYHFAADMGGIGHISAHHAVLVRNNTLIDTHMLEAARLAGVGRLLYSSSACVYPSFLQDTEDVAPLQEHQAIPADPERGYGWEKLYAEQLLDYYREEFGLATRIVRLHNIYGPLGTYDGGREKAPAAICRKVAVARQGDSIEIWGDGEQTRSFCYVDDCLEGLTRIMRLPPSQVGPVNLGTDELVTINGLVAAVCAAAGKRLLRVYDSARPQGVRGRNSDNSLLKKLLGWAPCTPLEEGIAITYRWIAQHIAASCDAAPSGTAKQVRVASSH